MEKKFASQADLEEKKVSFDRLSDHAYAYTAEGDPNTGVVIGDDGVMVIDAQATPKMAQTVIEHIRQVGALLSAMGALREHHRRAWSDRTYIGVPQRCRTHL